MDSSDPILAAGVLILTRIEPRRFLLMRHLDRWDLPKGHAEPGESPRQTALREMNEETGLDAQCVQLDDGFEFRLEYPVRYEGQSAPRLKRVYYFVGWVDRACDIRCSEHSAAQWFPWAPPHHIQEQTIDPLLASVADFLDGQ